MGSLDTLFRDAAPLIIAIFSDVPKAVRRVVTTYDPEDGTEVEVTTSTTLVMSPPVDFETARIDGKKILETDFALYVAETDLEAKVFDIEPTDEVKVFVTVDGDEYPIVRTKVFQGDKVVFRELQVRK